MEIAPVIPDELRFAVTRKCDGACRHCYNQSGKDTDCLTALDFIEILRTVHALNPNLDRITLTGGEPLFEKDKVLAVSRVARSMGIRVRLVTRGWELNSGVCEELITAGVTRVQIGLDSSGIADYHDHLHRKWDTFHSWLRNDQAGFSRAVEGIKTAIRTGLDVSVRYSLCRTNLKDVVNTYHFVASLGVSKFKFRVLFPDGRAKERLFREFISGEEMANAQYELIEASGNNPTVVEITQPCLYSLPDRPGLLQEGTVYNAFKEACPCGTRAAFIDSNGDVKYCLFDENNLGNVRNELFMLIWNSGLAKEVRKDRCPLDRSGSRCSSFRLLYTRFGDYPAFMKDYARTVKGRNL